MDSYTGMGSYIGAATQGGFLTLRWALDWDGLHRDGLLHWDGFVHWDGLYTGVGSYAVATSELHQQDQEGTTVYNTATLFDRHCQYWYTNRPSSSVEGLHWTIFVSEL